MKPKPFTRIASLFWAVITILHIVRIVAGWEIVIDQWHVPKWISLVLAIITGTLSLMLLKENFSHKQ